MIYDIKRCFGGAPMKEKRTINAVIAAIIILILLFYSPEIINTFYSFLSASLQEKFIENRIGFSSNTDDLLYEIPIQYDSIEMTTSWKLNPVKFAGNATFLSGDLGIPSNWELFDNHRFIDSSGSIQILNLSDLDIKLRPLALEMMIFKVMQEKKVLVASYKAPIFEGEIAGKNFYSLSLPIWNQMDLNGNKVTPGTYIVELIHPEFFEYYIEGNLELQKYPINESCYVMHATQVLSQQFYLNGLGDYSKTNDLPKW